MGDNKVGTKDLLKLIGMGALIVGSVIAPGLPRVFLLFENKKRKPLNFDKRYFSLQLKRLKQRELIDIKEEDNETIINLSDKGKEKILKYNFDEMKINPSRYWDRKWRMVIFDIPEDMKVAREMFRQKLKELGFYRLQDSVFVYPFPCEKEIKFIREYLGVGDCVLFLTFQELEKKRLALSKFGF